MTKETIFADFSARLREFIRGRASASISSQGFAAESTNRQYNELAIELFGCQYRHNGGYRRFCGARKTSPSVITHWEEIPAVPTVAFKELDLTSLVPAERTVVFHSSGTTGHRPSRHFHNAESLAVYETSLLSWFRFHVSQRRMRMIFLTPPPELAPHSSLVHMFETVRRSFGSTESVFTGLVDKSGAWLLDLAASQGALEEAELANRACVLLGTAFNFVHLLDHLLARGQDFLLAAGSRIMETGGYKGRSRSLSKTELHARFTAQLGIPSSHIVCEYGMSELSSQAYDCVAGLPSTRNPVNCGAHGVVALPHARVFQFPPWARAQVVSPETGREVNEGETGLIRVFDLANVRSVLAVQTEDLAIRRSNGFELVGRATTAEPRGCSLRTIEKPTSLCKVGGLE